MIDTRSLFEGKRITVMGLGLLGRGLRDTLFLIRCGAKVTVTDLKNSEELAPSLEKLTVYPCTLKLGGHDPADFADADMILRNADVPRSSPFLKIARENRVPVEMDESLFCKHFQGRVVGITGTRGKTTTTMLVYKILAAHLPKVFLAGNLVDMAALPLLEHVGEGDTVVMELSSWQLQGFHDARLSPNAAIFTNIHPDHLNRYSGMDEYIEDKKALYRYQKGDDFCLFNSDQPKSACLAEEAPAGRGFFGVADVPSDWRIGLPGAHNLQNIAAAICLTRRMGVPEDLIRSFAENFEGVEHRLQHLGEINGVEFVNDSTSTTPVAGLAALEALSDKSILLIAGGSDKKLDLQPFAEAAAKACKKIALLDGTATEALGRGIIRAGGEDRIVGRFSSMRDAVEALTPVATPGDVILLSPGCASFGMFRNEYHRGETFMGIVNEMRGTAA